MEEVIGIRKKFNELRNEEQAIGSKKYLKSPYNFYGVSVPQVREISKSYFDLDFYSFLNLFDDLWNSGYHEEMWLALFIMEKQFEKNINESWKFLTKRLDKIKTWDHVDELSSSILGKILNKRLDLIKEIKEMSLSKNPWIRRISIVSTLPMIKNNKIELTLRLAEKLVYDNDIYVQKGTGWMLREAGKRARVPIKEFIMMHLDMKSSAFSYATEKMTELREIKKRKLKEQKEFEKYKKEQEKERLKQEKKNSKKDK